MHTHTKPKNNKPLSLSLEYSFTLFNLLVFFITIHFLLLEIIIQQRKKSKNKRNYSLKKKWPR